jgi:hypothetical protein
MISILPDTLKITIQGANVAPSWSTIEMLIEEALDRSGKFTRISRDDHGCNYRATGSYTCDFVPERGDFVTVKVEVT